MRAHDTEVREEMELLERAEKIFKKPYPPDGPENQKARAQFARLYFELTQIKTPPLAATAIALQELVLKSQTIEDITRLQRTLNNLGGVARSQLKDRYKEEGEFLSERIGWRELNNPKKESQNIATARKSIEEFITTRKQALQSMQGILSHSFSTLNNEERSNFVGEFQKLGRIDPSYQSRIISLQTEKDIEALSQESQLRQNPRLAAVIVVFLQSKQFATLSGHERISFTNMFVFLDDVSKKQVLNKQDLTSRQLIYEIDRLKQNPMTQASKHEDLIDIRRELTIRNYLPKEEERISPDDVKARQTKFIADYLQLSKKEQMVVLKSQYQESIDAIKLKLQELGGKNSEIALIDQYNKEKAGMARTVSMLTNLSVKAPGFIKLYNTLDPEHKLEVLANKSKESISYLARKFTGPDDKHDANLIKYASRTQEIKELFNLDTRSLKTAEEKIQLINKLGKHLEHDLSQSQRENFQHKVTQLGHDLSNDGRMKQPYRQQSYETQQAFLMIYHYSTNLADKRNLIQSQSKEDLTRIVDDLQNKGQRGFGSYYQSAVALKKTMAPEFTPATPQTRQSTTMKLGNHRSTFFSANNAEHGSTVKQEVQRARSNALSGPKKS